MKRLTTALNLTGFRLLGMLLLLLTVMALSPWNPQGPYDARDYQQIEGVSLSYPWWGTLFEPLFAPAHVLMGAPDFRQAIIASGAWVVVLAILVVLWHASRQTPRRPLNTAWRLLLIPAVSLSLYLAYVIAAAVLYFPSWSLEVKNPEWLIADLQSHTLGSHDGIVTARKSLQWHRVRGYNLIAVTEHNDPTGAFAARDLADQTRGAPVVIPGVEVNTEHEDFLLGIGLKNTDILRYEEQKKDYARHFIADIHQRHHGAAIALAWGMAPERVDLLADDGIDAFELVNTGHPDISLPLRKALLRAAKHKGVVMLASTDWHGWSGFSRTWTLVHIPDSEQMSRSQIASRTVELLRQHRQDAFVPVVSGYMGPVNSMRTVFSPFAESVRYGAELSMPRLISWWVWAGLLVAMQGALRKRRLATGKTLLASVSLGLGSVLLLRASELYGSWQHIPATKYTVEMGHYVVQLGFIAVAIGVVTTAILLWQRNGDPSKD